MITPWGRNNSTSAERVLLMLEELELPYEQIFAGREFGINHGAGFLTMNPNGLMLLLRDNESDLILWEPNVIARYLVTQYGQKHLWVDSPARRVEAEKWTGWTNQTLGNTRHGILMGLARTSPEERDQTATDASCKECDVLFALLDAELVKIKWFSGDEFGVGNITIAPFIYNLPNIDLIWTPRPNLQRRYQQLIERPAACKVVMIPVN